MSELVTPDGRAYVPPKRPEPEECPKCGADEKRFQPVLGGEACCMDCGCMKERVDG
jgi:hypothetical protein|tara:strand:+ start:443 stop:610 length:168 start_codon:yes stop_codon:yes gene_type:complete